MKTKQLLLFTLFMLASLVSKAEMKVVNGYYQIGSVADLQEFTMIVRNGQTVNAQLTCDLDMTGVPAFTPIGFNFPGMVDCPFRGVFDGQCHVIRNLTIEADAENACMMGLFGYLQGGTVQNLGVENISLTSEAGMSCGALVGTFDSGKIINCYTAGKLELNTLSEEKGGLFGTATESSVLTNCFTTYETLGFGEELAEMKNVFAGAAMEQVAASGLLCYLLNGDQSVIRFRQNLGEDPHPVFNETHKQVYAVGKLKCDGTALGEVTYSNTPSEEGLPPHDYNEDGICSNCGAPSGVINPDEDGWYNVTTADELRYVSRNVVNAGSNRVKIRLMNDIDLGGIANFPPIGKFDYPNGDQIAFKGVFDGQNHIIYNLRINITEDETEGGLFSRVNDGGRLMNFGVVNASVIHERGIRVGVIAGEIHACQVDNVFSAGNLYLSTSNGQCCGFAGEAYQAILNNCYTTHDLLAHSPQAANNCAWGAEAAEGAISGALCYKLNHQDFRNPTWFQSLGEDEFPVLDNTHGIVYKTDEDSYASATTAEEVTQMVKYLIEIESNQYNEIEATESLVNNYLTKLNALENSSLEEYLQAYEDMAGLRSAIEESATVYAAYMEKVAQLKEALEANEEFGSEDRDMLLSYVTDKVAPGEKFANGSYAYIAEKMEAMADDMDDEIAWLTEIMNREFARSYTAGSDITSMLTNADFSNGTEGWTFTRGGQNGYLGNVGAKVKNVVGSTGAVDINSTLTDLKNGIYEVCFNAYSELEGESSEATYNYTAFVYANGNKNYVKTQRADLLSEEVFQKYPNNLGEVYDVVGDVQGYAPNSYQGLAYAFSEGYYENRILVEVTDGNLTLGLKNLGVRDYPNHIYYANTKLTYLGTMEQAAKSMNGVLNNMLVNARHIQNDYEAAWDVFAEAPNYEQALKDRLAEEISKASAAQSAEEKYQAICRLGDLFQEIYDSKQSYLQLTDVLAKYSDAFYQQNSEGDDNEILNRVDNTMMQYENGSLTNAQIATLVSEMENAPFYLLTYGNEPDQVDGVYQLSTPEHLLWLSQYVGSTSTHRGLKVALMNDIDMSGVANFTPIGTFKDGSIDNYFQGEFDGQGHIVKNITINVYNGCEAGFFGRAYGSTIKNLGIVNATVTNSEDVRAGILGGELHMSTVTNCYTAGNLVIETENPQTGGISGEAASTNLVNCYTTYPGLTNAASLESNCYYGEEAEAMAATGELTFRLNGNQSKITWYQTLGEDAFPTLDSSRAQVYRKGDVDCGGNSVGEVAYTNEVQSVILPEHTFGEDGLCTVCGEDGGKMSADEDGYFAISNAYQLRYFATYVNTVDASAKGRLKEDIDMSVVDNFPMLGRYHWDYEGSARNFQGVFDGDGHVIKNLRVVVNERVEAGFISRSYNATIMNVGFENPTIINTHKNGVRAGVLGGELHQTTITNCWSYGDIVIETPHAQKGGLGGEAAASAFNNCWTTYSNLGQLGGINNSYAGADVEAMHESGELCYKLNGGKVAAPAWRQNLGEDMYPVLNSTHKVVYLGEDGNYTNGNSLLPIQKGTEDDPYIIMDANDLIALNGYLKSDAVNYVQMGADVDMSKVTGWEPVCGAVPYVMNFDGKGHTISNLTCGNSLFGNFSGKLFNLGLENMTVTGTNATGMIAATVGNADMTTYVEHVYVNGKLSTGDEFGGGMFGKVAGSTEIKNCYANVEIQSASTYTGGIVGKVSDYLSLENVYAAGSSTKGGGIVGGGQTKDTPASRYQNVAVWNNDYQLFGRTEKRDTKQGILYYNSKNFADLQTAVVGWDKNVWSCDMQDGSYPILVGSASAVEGVAEYLQQMQNDAVYTLTGVRINKADAKQGIYIVNGKKVLINK